MPDLRQAELAALVDHLVSIGGQAFERGQDVGRVGARAGESEMLAGAPIQHRHPLSLDWGCALRAFLAPQQWVEQALELGPFGLVQLFEVKWGHERRPNSHCATPSTRWVTALPEWPWSPDTAAAIAANSFSRLPVRVGARAASATRAAWSRGARDRIGATGSTFSNSHPDGRMGLVDNECGSGEVAQAFAILSQQHADHRDSIAEGQEVRDAQQVAREGGRGGDRQTVVHHHFDAERFLAGRGAGAPELECNGIEPFQREQQDQPEGDAHAAHEAGHHGARRTWSPGG